MAICYGCTRDTRDCWIMPCLVLEQAMTSTRGLAAWAARCGLIVRDRRRLALVVSERRS